MRFGFPLSVVGLLGLLTAAGTGASDGSSVIVQTDRESYGYADVEGLSRVMITLSNQGEESIFLPSAFSFVIRDSSTTVFEPGSTQMVHELAPSGQVIYSWDFRTTCSGSATSHLSCAGIALPGSYQIIWEYADSFPYETLEEATTWFDVHGV